MNGYVLQDDYGMADYSADPADYFMFSDDTRFMRQVLVKLRHRYRTATGRFVTAPRVIKSNPRLRDLKRLERAYLSVTQQRSGV